MDTIFRTGRLPRPARLGGGPRLLAGMLAGATYLLDLLAFWGSVARQRRHLSALDDRLLRDIGLSRADVEGEAGRRFWDI